MRAIGYKMVGHLWPNGEVGIGRVKETSQHPFDGALETPAISLAKEYTVTEFLDRIEGRMVDAASGVDLTNVAKNHTAESRAVLSSSRPRGTKGLTRYGARMLRNACHVIELEGERNTFSFATLTLPEMEDTVRGEILKEWGNITRTFFQGLSRILRRKGLNGWVAYVTEIQPARLEETGKAYPHLHCVFQGKKARYGKGWALTPKEIGDLWKRVISTRVPDSSAHFNENHWNVQGVIKTPSAYLAKYMSKGSSQEELTKDPTYAKNGIASWWGAVGGLKTEVIRRKKYLNTSECLMLLDYAAEDCYSGEFWYKKDLFITIDETTKLWIGWAGKLKPDLHKEIAEYHDAMLATGY